MLNTLIGLLLVFVLVGLLAHMGGSFMHENFSALIPIR
jgi:hypothetical protein